MIKYQPIIESSLCLFFGIFGAHQFFRKDYINGGIYYISFGCLILGFILDFILTIVDYDFTHALKQEERIKNEKPVKTYNILMISLLLSSIIT